MHTWINQNTHRDPTCPLCQKLISTCSRNFPITNFHPKIIPRDKTALDLINNNNQVESGDEAAASSPASVPG
jgi:hypothetical protein